MTPGHAASVMNIQSYEPDPLLGLLEGGREGRWRIAGGREDGGRMERGREREDKVFWDLFSRCVPGRCAKGRRAKRLPSTILQGRGRWVRR